MDNRNTRTILESFFLIKYVDLFRCQYLIQSMVWPNAYLWCHTKLKSFSKEFPFIPADQFLCLTWMWVKCDTDLLIKPFRYDKYHLLMEIILTWDKVKSRAACPVSPDNIKDKLSGKEASSCRRP